MKKLAIFISSLLISINSFAGVNKISAEEFTSLYDKGKLTFEIMPIGRNLALAILMNINKSTDKGSIPNPLLIQIEKELVKDYQSKYIYFDPEFFNIRYIEDGPWRYSVSFDYATDKKCKLRVEKIDPKCGNPVCEAVENPQNHPNVDINGTVIEDKYCEKIYNVKLKK